jgi:hypothetical protein
MKPPTPEEVSVTLVAPHTHAGKAYKAGDRISVTLAVAQWLINQRVIKVLPASRGKGRKGES